MRVARDRGTALPHQEIEVRALIRLHDMFNIKLEPAALGNWRRPPFRPPRGQGSVIDIELKQTFGDIERDHISRMRERYRTAGREPTPSATEPRS